MNVKRRIALSVVAVAAVFSFVWQQLQSVRMGFEVERTRRMVEAQQDRNAYLRMELERELSPEWLTQAAKGRLGMGPPAPEAVIVLEAREHPEPSRAARAYAMRIVDRLFAPD